MINRWQSTYPTREPVQVNRAISELRGVNILVAPGVGKASARLSLLQNEGKIASQIRIVLSD